MALAALSLAATLVLHAPAEAQSASGAAALKITSPLGRTGLSGAIRIVVRLDGEQPAVPPRVEFYIDKLHLADDEDGPPYEARLGRRQPVRAARNRRARRASFGRRPHRQHCPRAAARRRSGRSHERRRRDNGGRRQGSFHPQPDCVRFSAVRERRGADDRRRLTATRACAVRAARRQQSEHGAAVRRRARGRAPVSRAAPPG